MTGPNYEDGNPFRFDEDEGGDVQEYDDVQFTYKNQRQMTAAERLYLRGRVPLPELFDELAGQGAVTIGIDPVMQTRRYRPGYMIGDLVAERPATPEEVRRYGGDL